MYIYIYIYKCISTLKVHAADETRNFHLKLSQEGISVDPKYTIPIASNSGFLKVAGCIGGRGECNTPLTPLSIHERVTVRNDTGSP